MRNHHFSLALNVLLVLATRMTIRVPGTVAAVLVVSSSTSTNIPNNDAMKTSDPTTSGIYTYPFQYIIHGNTRRQLQLQGPTSPLSTTNLAHFDASMADGALYMDLYVGNPAQKQTLAISIAGDFVAFPCTGCTDCGVKLDEFYNIGASDHFTALQCGSCEGPQATCEGSSCILRDTYLDGASKWTAYQAKDQVYIDGQGGNRDPKGTNFPVIYGFPMSFGCLTTMSGYFDTNSANGILGMSPSKQSFINQIYDAGKVAAPIFGICFNSLNGHPTPKGFSAGAIALGGIDPRYHNTPLVFAKNSDPRKMSFRVNLEKIYLRPGGGSSATSKVPFSEHKVVDGDYKYVNSVGRGVFLDTGSPYTIMDRMLEQPFKDVFMSMTTKEYTKDMEIQESDYKKLPTVLFQFTGWDTTIKQDPDKITGFAGNLDVYNPFSVVVAMPPGAYMLFNETLGVYQPKLFFDSIDGSVLGVNFFTGHDVIFDLQKNRIGFAENGGWCTRNPYNSSEPKPLGFYGDKTPNGKVIGNSNPNDPTSTGIDSTGKGLQTDDSLNNGNGSPGSAFDPNMLGGAGSNHANTCGTGLSYSACCSATCKSFVAVGYATVIITGLAAVIAMKTSQTRRYRSAESAATSGVTSSRWKSSMLSSQRRTYLEPSSAALSSTGELSSSQGYGRYAQTSLSGSYSVPSRRGTSYVV